jgi:hypothetical protein
MSDRFYSTLKVSGPNTGAAEHAAIEALKAIDYETCRACWVPADEEMGPCFFDHDSGQSAVFALIDVAKKFPTEKFVLSVVGGYGEGFQGPFTIADGGATLIDGRSEEIASGDRRSQNIFLELTATGDLREVGRENKLVWWLREMRYLVRRTLRIVRYNFRPRFVIYNFCPRLAEMMYGPRVTLTQVAPRVRDEVEASDDISMEEVLGAGTHGRGDAQIAE